MLQYIVTQLEALNGKMNAIHAEFAAHKDAAERVAESVDRIEKAFPKNDEGQPDFYGHHDDHHTRIQAAKSWKEIWTDVRKKLFGGAAWAIAVFVLYSMWEAFKSELKK